MVKKYINALVFEWRLGRAKRKADRLADLYGRKYLVLVFRGRPVVVSMQGIKKLIRMRRFAKGFTPETANRCAIYKALPKNR